MESLKSEVKAIWLSSAGAMSRKAPSSAETDSFEHRLRKQVVDQVKEETQGVLKSIEPRIKSLVEVQIKAGIVQAVLLSLYSAYI